MVTGCQIQAGGSWLNQAKDADLTEHLDKPGHDI